jgi:hypothetical protein
MRLWRHVDGEPYMVNPRLGILALQALNPKKGRKTMAIKFGARHMAWVRSFRKKNYRARSHRKRHYRKNPYPLAGVVTALGNGRRRKHHRSRKGNPGGLGNIARGTLGLPPLMPVVYGAGGFIGTAMAQGFVDTLVPASFGSAASSPMIKYGEILVSIAIVSLAAKSFLGRGASAFAAVGGGIFLLQQAVHDFLPNVIPGMHAYTPLRAYTPVRRSSGFGGLRSIVQSAGGAFPQLAATSDGGMPQLATMDQGFRTSAQYAQAGSMNTVSERFRRF